MVFHTFIAGLRQPSKLSVSCLMTDDEDTDLVLNIHKKIKQGKIVFFVLIVGFVIVFSATATYVYINNDVNPKLEE